MVRSVVRAAALPPPHRIDDESFSDICRDCRIGEDRREEVREYLDECVTAFAEIVSTQRGLPTRKMIVSPSRGRRERSARQRGCSTWPRVQPPIGIAGCGAAHWAARIGALAALAVSKRPEHATRPLLERQFGSFASVGPPNRRRGSLAPGSNSRDEPERRCDRGRPRRARSGFG